MPCFCDPFPSHTSHSPKVFGQRTGQSPAVIQDRWHEGREQVWLWSLLECVNQTDCRKIRGNFAPCRTPKYCRPFLGAGQASLSSLCLSPKHLGGKRRNSVKKPDVGLNPYRTSGCLADISCRWPSVFWKYCLSHSCPFNERVKNPHYKAQVCPMPLVKIGVRVRILYPNVH